jgi:D-arabinose 1-dehydrogenase-like Zn-dependent alcohol dehydrogenase
LYLGSNAACWGKENFNEHGGCFSKVVRISAHFAVKIPPELPAEVACPLMCGGGTVFEALCDYASVGTKVGVIGIGGLGTSAIRLAKIKGATVTAISRSAKKEKGCYDEGVNDFLLSSDDKKMSEYAGKFDLLLDCTPVNADLGPLMDLLKFNGQYCRVGIPSATDANFEYNFNSMIFKQKKIAGSIIIGTARMNLLLEIVAANQDVFKNKPETFTEIVPFSQVNEAMDALQENKVKCYRTILAWDQ